MATTVRTVTLDSAFLREIKEDDCRLRSLLNHLRQHVVSRTLGLPDEVRLAVLVKDLRDRLAFHFRLEEAYGYFEDPISVAPRLSERVEDLRVEHGEMLAEVTRIAEMMDERSCENSTATELDAAEQMCREFLDRFELHETQENALIVQAFNEDIGGEE